MTKTTFSLLCVLILFCALPSLLTAQQLTLGFRGGLNIATWQLNNVSNPSIIVGQRKPRLGYLVAIPIEIRFDELFSLQPELQVLQKGVRSKSETTGGNFQFSAKSDFYAQYIELPLLAKFSFRHKSTKLSALVGGNIGAALAAKSKSTTTINGNTTTRETKVDIAKDADHYPRTDYGLNFGIELGQTFRKGFIILDVRYQMGIRNLLPRAPSSDFSIKNKGLMVSVGYMMPLGN